MSDESTHELEEYFEPQFEGVYMKRLGDAFDDSGDPRESYPKKKVCFVATDKALLAEVLYELSQLPSCWGVKYSTEDRDGMYLGRFVCVDEEVIGQTWSKYKFHPKLMCTVQDDGFTKRFRPGKSWE